MLVQSVTPAPVQHTQPSHIEFADLTFNVDVKRVAVQRIGIINPWTGDIVYLDDAPRRNKRDMPNSKPTKSKPSVKKAAAKKKPTKTDPPKAGKPKKGRG